MSKKYFLALVLCLPAFASGQSPGQKDTDTDKSFDNIMGSHEQYHAFFNTLQKDVAAHDATAVAKLVNYPITVKLNGRDTIIRTPAQFTANYDAVFTPSITEVVKNQKYADLFVRDQGAMFGNGQVWYSGVCLDKTCKSFVVKIIAIRDTAAKN